MRDTKISWTTEGYDSSDPEDDNRKRYMSIDLETFSNGSVQITITKSIVGGRDVRIWMNRDDYEQLLQLMNELRKEGEL